MADKFENYAPSQTSGAENAFAVTPNDAADLAQVTRGLYVGVSGDVKVTLKGGDAVTFVNLAGGVIHPLRVTRVGSTGTGATSILGVY